MSLITSVVVGSLLIHVPYVIESPGNLYTTGDRIAIENANTYPTSDRIDLVTVSIDTRVTAFEKFIADHNDDDVVVPAKDVLGTQTPAQNDAYNALLMKQSKDEAVVVALAKLGYNVHPTSTGAIIPATVPGAPADGVLNIGDTITAVDDQSIRDKETLLSVLGAHHPGDRVKVTVEAPDNTPRTVELTLAENPDKPGTPLLGIYEPTTRLSYPDLSVKVTVASGSIGGPSAGLAFTLGILDLMSPGDLTAGREIAATGTIDADGKVGDIGGIRGKVTAVSRAGVKIFLVPAGNAAEAQADAPKDMQIVSVSTIDDALNFLASLGGSGLPPPPSQ
jgi:PDZ domain-containing protein